MNTTEYASQISGELARTLALIDPAEGEALADQILEANKIFVAGAGRSGFMAKAFGMRLMHMGFEAHVVGETVTPGIRAGDLLLIGSGSGETESLVAMCRKAKSIGAAVALVTIFPDSSIGRMTDVTVRIPAPTPKVATDSGFRSVQPMGSLFEQSLLLCLDAVILRLMERQGQASDTMFAHHANLE